MNKDSPFAEFLDLDTLFGVAMMLFFIFVFVSSYGLESVSAYLLPRILSVIGSVATLSYLVRKLLQTFGKHMAADAEAAEEAPPGSRGVHLIITFVFAAVYFLIVEYLGFLLATMLAVWAFALLMRAKNWPTTIIISVALPLALHVLFQTLLRIGLPSGPVEYLLPF